MKVRSWMVNAFLLGLVVVLAVAIGVVTLPLTISTESSVALLPFAD